MAYDKSGHKKTKARKVDMNKLKVNLKPKLSANFNFKPKFKHPVDFVLELLKNVSIKNKIISIVIVSVLIPMALSTYVSGKIVAQSIEKEFQAKVSNIMDYASNRFIDYQKKALNNASILSNVTELRQYAAESNNVKIVQPSEKGILIQGVSPVKSDVSATGVRTVGVIVTQYNIDERFIKDIKQLYNVEATLYIKDQILSTLKSDKSTGVEKSDQALAMNEVLKAKVSGSRNSVNCYCDGPAKTGKALYPVESDGNKRNRHYYCRHYRVCYFKEY